LRRSRRAVSLVETLLGCAILATLLVTIVLAVSRLHLQAARAAGRAGACRAADELLEQWWKRPEALPRRSNGPVAGRPGWSWRTRPVESDSAASLGGQVVRLEVFAPGGPTDSPAASVELVLPEIKDAAGTDAH
jgi:hypothetical protein